MTSAPWQELSSAHDVLEYVADGTDLIAAVPEHDGQLYWGTNADDVAALIRDGMPAIVEASAQMPYLPSCPVPEQNVAAVVHTDRPLHVERARSLIGAAAPEHRDWLRFEAARARLL